MNKPIGPKEYSIMTRHTLRDRRLSTAAFPVWWAMGTKYREGKKYFVLSRTTAAKAEQKSHVPARQAQ